MEREREAAEPVDGRGDEAARLVQPRREIGRQLGPERPDPHPDRHHRLDRVVVDVLGQPLTLVLLRGHHRAGERAAIGLGAAQPLDRAFQLVPDAVLPGEVERVHEHQVGRRERVGDAQHVGLVRPRDRVAHLALEGGPLAERATELLQDLGLVGVDLARASAEVGGRPAPRGDVRRRVVSHQHQVVVACRAPRVGRDGRGQEERLEAALALFGDPAPARRSTPAQPGRQIHVHARTPPIEAAR